MSDEREQLDIAALLRAGADGELDASDAARLDEHSREHDCACIRMEFERELRCAVGRTMGEVCAPKGLRDRVAAACCEGKLGDNLERRAERTRKMSFWAGPIGSIVSVAATLVLAFVLVQLMIDVAGGSNVAHADEVHRFVSKQHHACMNGGDARKFNVHVADEVPVLFERLTETSIACDDLTGCESLGLRFVEAGQCRVPPHGKAKSVHLRFVSDGTNCRKGTSISVFIQPYVGYIPMEEGHAYRLDGEDDMVVYGWVRDHVVYYAVANAGEPCEVFRRAAGLPEPEELPDRS